LPVSIKESINFNLLIDLSSATLDFVCLIVSINNFFSSSKKEDLFEGRDRKTNKVK